MKKVLITGATGFAGSFLTEYLIGLGDYEIIGSYVTEDSLKNVESAKSKAEFKSINLLEKDAVESLIKEVKPEYIYHLAALASVTSSFKDPIGVITNNVSAQVNLLEAVRSAQIDPRILIVSSADIYGSVDPKYLPINEEAPLNPNNPYAVSKITQDFLGLQYAKSYSMGIIRIRPFNHIGPRQAAGYVVSDFAKRIVSIERGEIPPVLKVGNLDAKRDFTDVRDMVKAYKEILEKGQVREVYNIGRGVSFSMNGIIEKMRSLATTSFEIEKDPMLLRPSDTPELVADTTKLKSCINWEPEISLEQTLKDTLDFWRSK